MDVSKFIQAKSDQLNADDLMGGPITVRIMGVKAGAADQPVIIEIDCGYQPFKPSKTDRRVLCAAWGTDALVWIGRSMTLHRDPTVVYAGIQVGGIRITHLSDIQADLSLMLAEKRGKKKERLIKRLAVQSGKQAASQPAEKKAEPKKPEPMSDEEFFKKLEASKASIAAGKVTPEQVIAKIEAAVLLTDAQREELETLKPQQSDDPQIDTQAEAPDDMFDN